MLLLFRCVQRGFRTRKPRDVQDGDGDGHGGNRGEDSGVHSDAVHGGSCWVKCVFCVFFWSVLQSVVSDSQFE